MSGTKEIWKKRVRELASERQDSREVQRRPSLVGRYPALVVITARPRGGAAAGAHLAACAIAGTADSWGEGCAIAVIPVGDGIARWREVGFELPGLASRHAFLDLSITHPGLVPDDELGHAFALRGHTITRQ